MVQPLKLIVGLGNPGETYARTRHNIGFLALEHIARQNRVLLHACACTALRGETTLCGSRVTLLLPHTFMNNSGAAVHEAAQRDAIEAEDIIVIHDDMDIPFGSLKIKVMGGSAGHRGLDSIIAHISSDCFVRVRVGIGKPPENMSPIEYVLHEFSADEWQVLPDILTHINACIESVLTRGPTAAMNRFHGQPAPVRNIQTTHNPEEIL